jgi:protein-L-isoaspartate(D-aspartate) O-methyltransferase
MNPMNLEQARYNMVEQQIRPAHVLKETVREQLLAVRREDFVPTACRHLAFADAELPIGHGAAMLTPMVEARAIEALAVQDHEHVLEIGTGSGYTAALLSLHADQVTSLEVVPELAEQARRHLAQAGIRNVQVLAVDGAAGWPAAAPYDAILVSGGLPQLPEELLAQLKVGGRLFAVVGSAPAMSACLVTRVAEDGFQTRKLFETVVAPLRSAPAASRFVF